MLLVENLIRHGCIAVQLSSQLFQLCRCQLGPIATDMLVYQAVDPTAPVLPAPIHQAGATAVCDVHDLLDRVAAAVQTNGLVARARGTIFAASVGTLQIGCSCFS